MADQKKLSVAEILAAARRADGKSGSAGPAAPAPAAPPASEAPAAAEASASEVPAAASAEPAPAKPAAKPAAAKPAAAAPGQRPSVADILAAARANKAAAPSAAAPAAAAPAEKPAPKPKPAAEKPAAAPKADKPAAAPAAGARSVDTSSILAAARTPARAGPLSKAEAAARQQATAAAEKPTAPQPAARVVVPPKPAAAQPKAKSAAAEEDRRWFVGVMLGSALGIGFAALASTAGMWGLALARFMFPNITTEPPSKFKVGPPSDFAKGVVSEKFKAQFGVWVVNTEYQGQSQIVALKTVCTHLGCTPNWLEGEQKFKCPCHGSGFYKDGINFEGPAPRPLERYAIRLADDGQLEVDKSRVFFEEMGQWGDAACFVQA